MLVKVVQTEIEAFSDAVSVFVLPVGYVVLRVEEGVNVHETTTFNAAHASVHEVDMSKHQH